LKLDSVDAESTDFTIDLTKQISIRDPVRFGFQAGSFRQFDPTIPHSHWLEHLAEGLLCPAPPPDVSGGDDDTLPCAFGLDFGSSLGCAKTLESISSLVYATYLATHTGEKLFCTHSNDNQFSLPVSLPIHTQSISPPVTDSSILSQLAYLNSWTKPTSFLATGGLLPTGLMFIWRKRSNWPEIKA
jgi:hypothetical protein